MTFQKELCYNDKTKYQVGGEFKMAYKISDDCIGCGICAGECPVGCIEEKDGKYVIKADECVGCGTCASVCPVEAPKDAE